MTRHHLRNEMDSISEEHGVDRAAIGSARSRAAPQARHAIPQHTQIDPNPSRGGHMSRIPRICPLAPAGNPPRATWDLAPVPMIVR